MMRRIAVLRSAPAIVTLFVTACAAAPAAEALTTPKGNPGMSERTATGTFDVTLRPTGSAEAPVSAMSIHKTFHGDLSGRSVGNMLAVRTPVGGSAGYVAMERVTGTLDGKSGSFALQHSGTMNKGAPALTITVVPDSGTGELEGLAGAMEIIVEGDKHQYRLRYQLPSR